MKKSIKVVLLVLIVLLAVAGVVFTFTPETTTTLVEPALDSLAVPMDSTAVDSVEPVVDSLGL